MSEIIEYALDRLSLILGRKDTSELDNTGSRGAFLSTSPAGIGSRRVAGATFYFTLALADG